MPVQYYRGGQNSAILCAVYNTGTWTPAWPGRPEAWRQTLPSALLQTAHLAREPGPGTFVLGSFRHGNYAHRGTAASVIAHKVWLEIERGSWPNPCCRIRFAIPTISSFDGCDPVELGIPVGTLDGRDGGSAPGELWRGGRTGQGLLLSTPTFLAETPEHAIIQAAVLYQDCLTPLLHLLHDVFASELSRASAEALHTGSNGRPFTVVQGCSFPLTGFFRAPT